MTKRAFLFVFLFTSILLFAGDSPLSTQSRQLLDDAAKVQSGSAAEVTYLLLERTYEIDAQGRLTATIHRQYRVETQSAVDDWSSLAAGYSPWYQDRPVLNARVITADGVEHVLDPKVLTDAPAKDDSEQQVYDDNRVYQGPLPAVARGAIVETEIVQRDREPFF